MFQVRDIEAFIPYAALLSPVCVRVCYIYGHTHTGDKYPLYMCEQNCMCMCMCMVAILPVMLYFYHCSLFGRKDHQIRKVRRSQRGGGGEGVIP